MNATMFEKSENNGKSTKKLTIGILLENLYWFKVKMHVCNAIIHILNAADWKKPNIIYLVICFAVFFSLFSIWTIKFIDAKLLKIFITNFITRINGFSDMVSD